MTLREFIKLYNFRRYYGEKENTQIIRIYSEFPTDWFEFGVNDWGYNDTTPERVEMFINKSILDKEVSSINYDDDNDVFCIHLYEGEPEKKK